MNGIWRLPTRTIDNGGLGVVAFDAIIACLVTITTCVTIVRRPKHWPQALMLYVGMVFLSIFFILHWVDVLIRHYRTAVLYNYIIFPAILHIVRVFSDIYILWGAIRIMRRYETLRREDPAYVVFAFLVFLAVYQLCLLFALVFTWLGFADLGVIDEIAKARSAFEVTFCAVQFFITIFATIIWNEESKTMFISKNYDAGFGQALEVAFVFLLIRSFCEVVIVGQLDRWPGHLMAILRARDVVYGLFSLPLVIFLGCAIPKNTPEDPLVTHQHHVLYPLKESILQQLQTATGNGIRTAPPMLSFLKTFDIKVAGLPSSERERALLRNEELRRLKHMYGKWKPIQKWEGPTPEVETPLETAQPIGTGPTVRRVDTDDVRWSRGAGYE